MSSRLLVLLCAVAGCSSPRKESPAAVHDAGPPDAAPAPAPADTAWELRYAIWRAGDMFGSIRDVTIKSDGSITVHTDLSLTGMVTVTPDELAPLVRLLDGDAFRSLPSEPAEPAAGTVTALVLRGARSLDARWGDVPTAAAPVIEEVMRLIPLAGSRPVFSVWINTFTPAGSEAIWISSAGRVELGLGPTVLGRATLSSEALDPLRALLAAPDLQGLELPFNPRAPITITVTGETRVYASYVGEVPEPARGLYQEARRIAAAVSASFTPPTQFSLEYTRQRIGVDRWGPRRVVWIFATRGLLVIDEDDGQGPREKQLAPDDVAALARALADPDLGLAPSVEAFPRRIGTYHRLSVSGDIRHDATFRDAIPPSAEAVIDVIDRLAQ